MTTPLEGLTTGYLYYDGVEQSVYLGTPVSAVPLEIRLNPNDAAIMAAAIAAKDAAETARDEAQASAAPAIADEVGVIHRFRWGDRTLAIFDPGFTNARGAFRPISGLVAPADLTFLDDDLETPLAQRIGPGVALSSDLVGWGDSFQTRDNGGGTYLAQAAATLGVSAANNGIGGQTSEQIAARQGARPALLSVAGNSIPASGAVSITYLSTRLLSTPATTSATRTLTGYLEGVHGTLTCVESASGDSSDAYTFTRTSAGSAVKISPETPFIPDNRLLTRWAIIGIGRNDVGNLDLILERTAAIVSSLGHANFLVVGVSNGSTEPTGSAGYNNVVALNRALAKIYGERFIDIRGYVIAHGLSDAGITPTAQDNTDIANDVPPDSLRDDTLHPDAPWIEIIAGQISDRITYLLGA